MGRALLTGGWAPTEARVPRDAPAHAANASDPAAHSATTIAAAMHRWFRTALTQPEANTDKNKRTMTDEFAIRCR